jgi:ribose transport system substrate-binding protein
MRGSRLSFSLTFCLAVAACGRKAHERPQVGIALSAQAAGYDQDLQSALRTAGDSAGFDLHVSSADADAARQTAQVDSLVAQDVDAIVIVPLDGGGIGSAIARANAARIPVVTVDVASDEGLVAAHVASDDREGGRLLGAYVAGRIHGGGNVAILDQPGVARVRDRVAGFRAALAAFPNIRIVAALAVEPATRDAARQKTDLLLGTGQHLDALFGTDDECALGALAALQAAGTAGTVVVGFGAAPAARAAIASGAVFVAAAAPDPGAIARRVIAAVAAALAGHPVPSGSPVPVRLLVRDSLTTR